MSRLVLAFQCFFLILFGKRLPVEALKLLPGTATSGSQPGSAAAPADGNTAVAKPAAAPPPAEARPTAPAPRPAGDGRAEGKDARKDAREDRPRVSAAQQHRDGALAMLALLQREGRLVDFLREAIDGFSDAEIGAAARDVHRGCRKVLDQHLAFEPVMPGSEEAQVSVPKGFDPAEVRLIGEARGEPPFRGTLRHHGWRVVDAKLPALADGVDRTVIAPAEVEL
jgi:hypothetical protein